MKKKTVTLIIVAMMLPILSCSKKTTREPLPEPVPQPEDSEVYLKEGFIARDLFRIVLIDCQDENYSSLETVEEKSEKRALATLQKYLLDQNRVYDNNTRAELLNLIRNNGNFSKQDILHNGNSVYYLEIRKENIRRHINGMARPR